MGNNNCDVVIPARHMSLRLDRKQLIFGNQSSICGDEIDVSWNRVRVWRRRNILQKYRTSVFRTTTEKPAWSCLVVKSNFVWTLKVYVQKSVKFFRFSSAFCSTGSDGNVQLYGISKMDEQRVGGPAEAAWNVLCELDDSKYDPHHLTLQPQ